MTDFPRLSGALPRIATPPKFPVALQSWGQSGKGQFRSTQNLGRTWEEIYPVLDTSNGNVRALIETINRSVNLGLVWAVQHPYWHSRQGLGGGATILVAGAAQVGSVLNVDGATPNVIGWLKHGDMVQVVGCSVVFDVTADCNSDGGGNVAIPINPPIFSGKSPADDVAVTIDPTLIKFNAVIASVTAFSQMDSTKYIDAGLTVIWREQPS